MPQSSVINIIEEGRFGGPQNRILRVAKQLSPNWKTLVVFPKDNSEDFARLLDKNTVLYKALPIHKITKNFKALLFYVINFIPEIIALNKLIREQKSQVVHISGGAWQFKGVIAGYFSNAKVIWHLNDTSMPVVIRCVFSVFSFMADGYIFASHKTMTYYKPLVINRKPYCVIPAPVDTAYFSSAHADQTRLRRHLSLELDDVIVGLVANINPNKGIFDFVKAASSFDDPSIHFVVIGQVYFSHQNYYDSINQYIVDHQLTNVHFIHNVTDVRDFMSGFDVYVCASYFESSPCAVWEAMSLNVPIVATDCGDVPRHLVNGLSGIVLPDHEISGFVDAIRKYLSCPDLARDYASNARQTAIQKLDTSAVVRLHEDFYSLVTQS